MSKAKRLIELMMTVNRKRVFTVKEIANEFQVSQRTILRDLQELSELGVPLYSEVGPHGGYRVLNDRILPPIAFTEGEATAIFFAIHALRHYVYVPFEAEFSSALKKFFHFMPEDVRKHIDRMKNRVEFVMPTRQVKSPHLSLLVEAAVQQKAVHIEYESRAGKSSREIQPIGLYALYGLWYCPAYCFLRGDFRLFRCDRILSAASSESKPIDLQNIHLGNREAVIDAEKERVDLYVGLSKDGVERCEIQVWPAPELHVCEDRTGWLEGSVPRNSIPFFAKFFIGLGTEATVHEPPELIECIKRLLSEIIAKYA